MRRRNLEDIIDDLVLELGGSLASDLILPEQQTRTTLRNIVETLARAIPLWVKFNSRENRAAEAEYAKLLHMQSSELIALLEKSIGTIDLRLFGPPSPYLSGMSPEDINAAMAGNKDALLTMLRRVRAVANARNKMLRPHRGGDRNVGNEESAGAAYNLIEALSRKQITGTTGGAFETITALLCEACGRCLYDDEAEAPQINVKRACDRVLRLHRP